jgi:hypothetical protein
MRGHDFCYLVPMVCFLRYFPCTSESAILCANRGRNRTAYVRFDSQ